MENAKRLHYMDAARAIAVLLVIFGHTFRESMREEFYWCDFSYLYVYRFHVSLLFILSGMGYALTQNKHLSEKAGSYIAKKAKSLLLPWISYSLVIYAVFAIMWSIPQMRSLLEGSSYAFIAPAEYISRLLRNENPYCFHVWYLQTLFLFVTAIYIIDKYLPQKYALIIKILIIASAPILYDSLFADSAWVIKGFMQKVHFFVLGTFLTDDFFRKNRKKLVGCGIICAAALAWMIQSPFVKAIYQTNYAGILMAYLENTVIAGLCVGIIALCVVFETGFRKVAEFGENTMPYYLYHQPFFCAFLGMVLYEKIGMSAALTVIICMTASLFVPYLVIKTIRNTALERIAKKIGLPV